MSDPAELSPQPVFEPNPGEKVFQQACNLGIGRFYFSKFQITEARPTSTDTLSRLERLTSGPLETKMSLSVPLAVSLPMTKDETQHLLILQNGRMLLIKIFDPKDLKSYQEAFSTQFGLGISRIDEILQINSHDLDLCVNIIKNYGEFGSGISFSYIDPLESDENAQTVLDALAEAKKTALELKVERQKRKTDFLVKATNILSED